MLSRWALMRCMVVLACLWPRWECRVGPGRTIAGGSSSRAHRPSPPPSPPPSPAAVGVRGYRRFHANDSLVGRPVPCTPDEKLCLSHNLVFHPPSAKCLALEGRAARMCDLAIDRAELETGSGHVVGTCDTIRRGDCAGFRMAFDGQCYRESLVMDVICGCPEPPMPHPLGGFECRCSPHQTGPRVIQPKENGRCVIPDLRSPYAHEDALLTLYPEEGIHRVQCSNDHCYVSPARPRSDCSGAHRRCFQQGKVWVPARKNCFSLLERGPCENNYVLVLSKNESFGNMAFCRHIRGDCPPGKIFMAFDHSCHDEREMRMIAPDLERNVFGDYIISIAHEIKYTPFVDRNRCTINIEMNPIVIGRTSGLPRPPCGTNNRGDCVVEVYAEPPLPLDDL